MTIIEKILRHSPVERQKRFLLSDMLKQRPRHHRLPLYVPFGQTVDEQLLWLREMASSMIVDAIGTTISMSRPLKTPPPSLSSSSLPWLPKIIANWSSGSAIDKD
jgi:hypothetical protein